MSTNRYVRGGALALPRPDYPKGPYAYPKPNYPRNPPKLFPGNQNRPPYYRPGWPNKLPPRAVRPIPIGSPPIVGGSRFLRFMLPRVLPWIGWALLAYDLYELYRLWKENKSPMGGYISCKQSVPRWQQWSFEAGPACYAYVPVGPNGNWGPGSPWLNRFEQTENQFRYDTIEAFYFPENPGFTIPAWTGYQPLAPWLPDIDLRPIFPPWIEPLTPPLLPSWPPVPKPVRVPWPFGEPIRPNPEPQPPGEPKGYHRPTPDVKYYPDPRPNGDDWPTRPPPNVKERKVKFRSNSVARKFLGALISGASEVGDLIDSLYEALPNKLQDAEATIKEKLATIYEHANDIDVAKAMENFIRNHLEDRIIGKWLAEAQEGMEEYGLELGSLRV